MIKPVLYIYEEGELEEVITGLKRIKKYIDLAYKDKYENSSKRSSKKVQRDSEEE